MITGELVCAACEGDEAARKTVLVWLYDELGPHVCPQVPNDDQEDVHHRALQAILRKMSTHAPRELESFRSWAISYGKMEVREYWGRRKRRATRTVAGVDLDAHANPSSSFHSRWHKRQLLRVLASLIKRLPQAYRAPLEHKLRGRKDTSIARRLKIAKGTVRWRRHEARRRLRIMFQDYLNARAAQRSMLAPESSS